MAEKLPSLSGAGANADLQRAAQLQNQGCWLEAAELYGQLALQDPADHRLRANQGNALWLADLPHAAATAYQRALEIQPTCGVSLRGLASSLRDLNRWPEALAIHQQAAHHIPPHSPEAAMNRWAESQLLLGEQRWQEGFAAMAARHHPPGQPRPDLLQPRLDLTTEQGFGDTFQFLRFVPELVERRRRAGVHHGLQLWVEPNLVELLQEGLAWLPEPPRVLAASALAAPPACLTLLDLPDHLGITALEPPQPYLLQPAPPRPQRRHPPLRVGVCWAAGRKLDDPFTAREYRKRSLPPAVLWRLVEGLQQRGAAVVSLQVGPDSDTAATLGLPLSAPPESIASFSGTARVLQHLDGLISVDTAVAHLAGALGVPAWILLPWSADPRWLAAGSSTPWYRSLQLIRQPHSGDWHGAISNLLAIWDRA